MLLGLRRSACSSTRLFILAHEAAHYRLFADRTLNDTVGRAIGMAGGVSMCTYRVIHRLHHNNLYTEEDPDTAIHGGYPRGVAYLWKKLAQDLLGLNAWKTFAYFFGAPAINDDTQRAARPLDDTSPQLRAARAPIAGRWSPSSSRVPAARACAFGGLAGARAVSGALGVADAHGAAADPAPASDLRARCGDRPVISADRGTHQPHLGRRRNLLGARAAVPAPRELPPRAPSLSGGAALPPAARCIGCSTTRARSPVPRCATSIPRSVSCSPRGARAPLRRRGGR